MDIVKTHPSAPTIRTVINTSKTHDVVIPRAGLGVHAVQSDLWSRVIDFELGRTNDDFRLDDWYVFAAQIKQAFPEYELKELDLSHPIFNCFFSIKTLDVQPPYGRWTPKFYGLEDSTGRLMMIVNYNNDVSDYWQWSGNPFYPIDTTNEAYKFGVNYIIYALTH